MCLRCLFQSGFPSRCAWEVKSQRRMSAAGRSGLGPAPTAVVRRASRAFQPSSAPGSARRNQWTRERGLSSQSCRIATNPGWPIDRSRHRQRPGLVPLLPRRQSVTPIVPSGRANPLGAVPLRDRPVAWAVRTGAPVAWALRTGAPEPWAGMRTEGRASSPPEAIRASPLEVPAARHVPTHRQTRTGRRVPSPSPAR